MPGLFSTLNTAFLGMQAQQRSLQTTAHNVANANTEGFSRQKVVLETTPALPAPSISAGGEAGQIGTGVMVAAIDRIRDQLLDRQIREENSILGFWEQREGLLEQVEVVFGEPSDTGLSTLISQFWNSWQELSKNSASSPVRTTVLETAVSLADAIRHTYNSLDSLRGDLDRTLEVKTDEFNSLLQQISQINVQVAQVRTAGDSPNDLLDRRDLLLDKLSALSNYQTVLNSDGTADVETGAAGISDYSLLNEGKLYVFNLKPSDGEREVKVGFFGGSSADATAANISQAIQVSLGKNYAVSLDGATISVEHGGQQVAELDLTQFQGQYREALVVGKKVAQWKTAANASGSLSVVWDNPAGTAVTALSSGVLAGLVKARDEVLQPYIDRLNQFAETLVQEVNTIHRAGYNMEASPQSGLDFFKDTAGQANPAANIQVDIKAPAEIAAASTTDTVPGDGTNALLIAQLKQKQIGALGGTGFEGFYKNMVARLGVEGHESKRMVENQNALTQQLTNRKDSITGVSVDEEMTDIIRFQQAYNASAKVISVVNDLLDTLIDMVR